MVTKVNDIDLRVLAQFTKGYDKEHYIRELEKILGVSSRTALLALARLEHKGILNSRMVGKTKVYAIQTSSLSREYFLLAEQYKKIRFLEKNPLIKEILEKIDTLVQGTVIVFGSCAKGTQKDDSDLDLFVVGKYDEEGIKNSAKIYGIDINIKSYPKKVFEKELHDDILLKEVLDNHIVIRDVEGFVRKVLRWIR